MIRYFSVDIICRQPELRVLIHDTLTMKDKHFREIREVWKEHYFLLRDTIGELQTAGMINSETKPSWATLFVLGMLTWITYWFDFARPADVEDYCQAGGNVHSERFGDKKRIVFFTLLRF